MKEFKEGLQTMQTTPVYLTADECEQFANFQKHRGLIRVLDEIEAWDVKSGKITIHFDMFGHIQAVDKQEHFRLPID